MSFNFTGSYNHMVIKQNHSLTQGKMTGREKHDYWVWIWSVTIKKSDINNNIM